MSDLLPCPMCGGEASYGVDGGRKGTMRQSMIVVCTSCGCRVESGDVSGLTEPERWAWNVRAATLPAPLNVGSETFPAGSPLSDVQAAIDAPVDMLLFCPACATQHVDAPETEVGQRGDRWEMAWTNPPHRSHLCHACGHIWRPADVPTNGVAAIQTRGSADSPPVSPTDWKKAYDKIAAVNRDWSTYDAAAHAEVKRLRAALLGIKEAGGAAHGDVWSAKAGCWIPLQQHLAEALSAPPTPDEGDSK